MSFGDIISVVILPILAISSVLTQWNDFTTRWNKRTVLFFIISLFTLLFSVYVGLDNISERRDLTNKIDGLSTDLKASDSTLNATKDTLVKIGLSIDEKTGKLLIMDSQLLKKQFTQISNNSYTIVSPVTNERDLSKNDFDVSKKGNFLYISPKNGKWFNAYVAFDTSAGQDIMNHVEYAPGSSMDTRTVVPFNINGKIFSTFVVKIMGTPVWSNSPIIVTQNPKIRYIIFGDEGVSHKRYIYQSGKVDWVPE